MDKIKDNSQVIAEAPPDEEFSELESIDHEEIYDYIARFIKKAIPVTNVELTVINGLTNRVVPPKAPLVLLQNSWRRRVVYSTNMLYRYSQNYQ